MKAHPPEAPVLRVRGTELVLAEHEAVLAGDPEHRLEPVLRTQLGEALAQERVGAGVAQKPKCRLHPVGSVCGHDCTQTASGVSPAGLSSSSAFWNCSA